MLRGRNLAASLLVSALGRLRAAAAIAAAAPRPEDAGDPGRRSADRRQRRHRRIEDERGLRLPSSPAITATPTSRWPALTAAEAGSGCRRSGSRSSRCGSRIRAPPGVFLLRAGLLGRDQLAPIAEGVARRAAGRHRDLFRRRFQCRRRGVLSSRPVFPRHQQRLCRGQPRRPRIPDRRLRLGRRVRRGHPRAARPIQLAVERPCLGRVRQLCAVEHPPARRRSPSLTFNHDADEARGDYGAFHLANYAPRPIPVAETLPPQPTPAQSDMSLDTLIRSLF